MRLFHFSDDPQITAFWPRSRRIAVNRGPERDWLNGPLVWATDEAHVWLYLFPRDCPRIIVWPTPATTPQDRDRWFGSRTCRAIAFVEDDWLDRIMSAQLYRYRMPTSTFEAINDVGMWVSRQAVVPLGLDPIPDVGREMETEQLDLQSLPRLTSLKTIWQTSLHASGIRLRNAQDWGGDGSMHLTT